MNQVINWLADRFFSFVLFFCLWFLAQGLWRTKEWWYSFYFDLFWLYLVWCSCLLLEPLVYDDVTASRDRRRPSFTPRSESKRLFIDVAFGKISSANHERPTRLGSSFFCIKDTRGSFTFNHGIIDVLHESGLATEILEFFSRLLFLFLADLIYWIISHEKTLKFLSQRSFATAPRRWLKIHLPFNPSPQGVCVCV